MHKLLLFLLASCGLYGGQSVTSPGFMSSSLPTISGNSPSRTEGYIHGWAVPVTNSQILGIGANGINFQLINSGAGGTVIQLYDTREVGNAGCTVSIDNAQNAVYWRWQHDPAGTTLGTVKSDLLQVYNIRGVVIASCTDTYTSINASSTGLDVRSISGSYWGFLRVYSTLVSPTARMPVTSDVGDLVDYKFDGGAASPTVGTLNDTNGHYNLSGGTPTYIDQPYQIVVATPRTLDAPAWNTWTAQNAGGSNQLDGTSSFSQSDASATVTYLWQCLTAPSNYQPYFSSRTSGTPTVTGLTYGEYTYQLTATSVGNGATSTATLSVGSVAQTANGVVIPADSRITDFYGPFPAFGKNPWGLFDERARAGYTLRSAIWTTPESSTSAVYTPANPSWANWQTGTVDYYWNGRGNGLGTVGTTLHTSVTGSSTAFDVDDVSVLDLSTLPTTPVKITLATDNVNGNTEEIQICSTSGTTGRQTLTACFDGRGHGGGTLAPAAVLGPTSWNVNAVVGQNQFKGTGTNFLATLCPAGVGPTGPIEYSTGTIHLTNGSAAIVGTGTVWSPGLFPFGNYAIRAVALHSGTPYVFWAVIDTVTDTTHITANRNFTGDTNDYSYQIIHVFYRYPVSAFFPAPFNGETTVQWGGMTCDSDTSASFSIGLSLGGHDVPGQDGTHKPSSSWTWADTYPYVSSGGLGGYDFYGEQMGMRIHGMSTGLSAPITLANSIDNTYLKYPPFLGQAFVASILFTGAPAMSSIVSRALGFTTIDWNLVRGAANSAYSALNRNSGCNDYDTRDATYFEAQPALMSIYDPDASNITTYWKPYTLQFYNRALTCKSPAPATGIYANSWANSLYYNQFYSGALTATNGSKTVTITSTGTIDSLVCDGTGAVNLHLINGSNVVLLNSGTIPAPSGTLAFTTNGLLGGQQYVSAYNATRIDSTHATLAVLWPGDTGDYSSLARDITNDTTSVMSIGANNNDPNLVKNYSCILNTSTSMTLDRNWEGSTATNLHAYPANVSGLNQQPFMLGIKVFEMNQASRVDSQNGTNFANLVPLASTWLINYGLDQYTSAIPYGTVGQFSQSSGVPTTNFNNFIVQGNRWGSSLTQVVVGNTNLAEAMQGWTNNYLASPTTPNRTLATTVYGQIWCATGYMLDNTIPCTSTSQGNNLGATNLTNAYLAAGKWYGFFFGMGMGHQWAGYYLGGVPTYTPKSYPVQFFLASVPTAAKFKLYGQRPDGSAMTPVVCTSSPCTIIGDDREGKHLLWAEYLTAGDVVLRRSIPYPY